ncbi:MAG TPA: RNA polymerase sigma factor [Bacillaceae bacterium]
MGNREAWIRLQGERVKDLIKELFQRFSKQERDSERLIFETFYKRVYQAAYYIVQDRELAQDVAQETFIKAFQSMHTVKDGEKLGAWLSIIASRTAIDFLRKIKRRNDFAAEDVMINEMISAEHERIPSVESIVEDKMMKNALYQELDKLKPEEKQVLILKYLHDMKYDEMAGMLEMNIATVKTRVHRAKLKLRESLEKQPELRELMFNGQK